MVEIKTKSAGVNACSTACSPLTDTLKVQWLAKKPYVGQYDYCSADAESYTQAAVSCAKCLQGKTGTVVLGNFINTMNDACISKPFAANHEPIHPQRDLFNTATIAPTTSRTAISSTTETTSATTSTNDETSSSSTQTSTSTSPTADPERPSSLTETQTTIAASTIIASQSTSASAQAIATQVPASGDPNDDRSQTGLTLSAAAGIGAAVAVLIIGSSALAAFLIMRRRRRTTTAAQSKSMELTERVFTPSHNVAEKQYVMDWKPDKPQLYEAPDTSRKRIYEMPDSSLR